MESPRDSVTLCHPETYELDDKSSESKDTLPCQDVATELQETLLYQQTVEICLPQSNSETSYPDRYTNTGPCELVISRHADDHIRLVVTPTSTDFNRIEFLMPEKELKVSPRYLQFDHLTACPRPPDFWLYRLLPPSEARYGDASKRLFGIRDLKYQDFFLIHGIFARSNLLLDIWWCKSVTFNSKSGGRNMTNCRLQMWQSLADRNSLAPCQKLISQQQRVRFFNTSLLTRPKGWEDLVSRSPPNKPVVARGNLLFSDHFGLPSLPLTEDLRAERTAAQKVRLKPVSTFIPIRSRRKFMAYDTEIVLPFRDQNKHWIHSNTDEAWLRPGKPLDSVDMEFQDEAGTDCFMALFGDKSAAARLAEAEASPTLRFMTVDQGLALTEAMIFSKGKASKGPVLSSASSSATLSPVPQVSGFADDDLEAAGTDTINKTP